jgi:hypothetical protein
MNNGVSAYCLIAFLALSVVMTGCLGDAPRSNPFDPLSETYDDRGSVTGLVTDAVLPRRPLVNATVELAAAEDDTERRFRTSTDGNGRFSLTVPDGVWEISVALNGYAAPSDTIAVRAGRTGDVHIVMNGIPVVEQARLNTAHISRWWPQESAYELEVVADVSDPDGLNDIVSVRLLLPDEGFAVALSARNAPGRYGATIPQNQLPGGSLHAFVGHDFVVEVRDQPGFSASVKRQIVRIIEAVPEALEPHELETTGPEPLLRWEALRLPYAFTYRIDVVRVSPDVHTVVKSVAGIASTEITYQISDPLDPGEYYWTVSVVDAFGNRSRSREAGFRVQ